MPLPEFLRFLNQQASVNVVAGAEFDSAAVTVDLTDVPLDEVMSIVARRLNADVTRVGSLYYLGQLKPEDRGILIRRVMRLDSDQIAEAARAFTSEYGKVQVLPDGLVIVADRAQVLVRISDMFDQVEASSSDSWVCQLHIIALSRNQFQQAGFEVKPVLDVATTFALTSGASAGSVALTGGLDAILRVARSGDAASVLAEPMVILGDGRTATLNDGRRVPIAQRTVSPEGTVTVSGFQFIDTGLTLNVTLRDHGRGFAGVKLTTSLSDIVGFVEGEAPITAETRLESTATVKTGGVYMLGSVQRAGKRQAVTGQLGTVKEDGESSSVVQIWGRFYRLAPPK